MIGDKRRIEEWMKEKLEVETEIAEVWTVEMEKSDNSKMKEQGRQGKNIRKQKENRERKCTLRMT